MYMLGVSHIYSRSHGKVNIPFKQNRQGTDTDRKREKTGHIKLSKTEHRHVLQLLGDLPLAISRSSLHMKSRLNG